MIKEIIGNFKLCFVKCNLETCEKRDIREMYKKARKGEIKDFTGISAPFEEPENPDIIIDTEILNPEESVKKILRELKI